MAMRKHENCCDYDLPPNIFAEAGVSPTIIFAYKPNSEELKKLQGNNYQVFSKEIKKVGYEVKTKNKVKCFETKYKINLSIFLSAFLI